MLLVDAFNVLHVTGVLPPDLAGLDLGALAALIGRSRFASIEARLICDGPTKPLWDNHAHDQPIPQSVQVCFAGPGKDADSLIEKLIRDNTAPRRLLIVSTDNRIRTAARRRRSRWLSSEAFLRILAVDHTRPRPRNPPSSQASPHLLPSSETLPEADIQHWWDEFAIEEAGLADIPAAHPPKPDPPADPDPAADADANPTDSSPTKPAIDSSCPNKNDIDNDNDNDDPIIRQALEEWPDRLDPEDLDMRRWLKDE